MKKKLLVLTVLSALLATSAVLAETRTCVLETTPKGFEVDAHGKAQLSDGRGESVEVKVAAKLNDGTVLIVSAVLLDGRKVDLGSISMLMGSGEFSLDSIRNRYSGAFPVAAIRSLAVRLQDIALLDGVCNDGDKEDVRR